MRKASRSVATSFPVIVLKLAGVGVTPPIREISIPNLQSSIEELLTVLKSAPYSQTPS